MSALLALQLGFKIWMVVDSIQRLGVGSWWPYFIFFFPFGSWIYFFVEKLPTVNLQAPSFRRPPSIEALRYVFQDSPSVENEVRLAAALYDAGEIAEAREHYAAIAVRDDAYLRAHYGLGLTAMAREDWAEAVASFQRVIELERGYADWRVWLDLADAQRRGGDPPAAIESLRQLQRTRPRMDHSLELARALDINDQKAEAREALERALQDYEHAPSHVKRSTRRWAREAGALLGELRKA
jgi:hypothetical protein